MVGGKLMQTILNQLLQLSASGFEFLMETSKKITSKTTGLTTWHHIQEMTCSVNLTTAVLQSTTTLPAQNDFPGMCITK